MWFLNKKKQAFTRIPKHIAFIMDGNGRWAQRLGMPRTFGHLKGVDAVKRVIKACAEVGVKVISFFVFSTENWARPKEEVDYIFSLAQKMMNDAETTYKDSNYKVHISGDIEPLDEETKNAINRALESTKESTGMIINFAINYGSRDEILNACNRLIEKGTEVTMEEFKNELYTADLPDPDIVVRTSGEVRLSNFLLYQLAYSELFFVKKYWPDFGERDVYNILKEYQTRNRKFGKIN